MSPENSPEVILTNYWTGTGYRRNMTDDRRWLQTWDTCTDTSCIMLVEGLAADCQTHGLEGGQAVIYTDEGKMRHMGE